MTDPTPRPVRRDDPHTLLEELAVGHALGALEPGDELRLQDHLPGCARCTTTVAETRAVMAHLAHDVEPVDPPASLLEGIRAGVAASGRVPAPPVVPPAPAPVVPPPARSGEDGGPRRTVPVAPRTAGGSRRPGGARPGRRAGVAGRGSAFVAAALTGLLALAGWNLTLRADNAQRQTEVAALESVLDSMRAPGADMVRLTDPTTGDVKAVAVVDQGRVSLVVDGLKPNDPTATRYVLWRLAAYGPAVKVAEFDVRSADHVEVVAAGRLPQRGVEKLAITHEALPVPTTGSAPVVQGVVGT